MTSKFSFSSFQSSSRLSTVHFWKPPVKWKQLVPKFLANSPAQVLSLPGGFPWGNSRSSLGIQFQPVHGVQAPHASGPSHLLPGVRPLSWAPHLGHEGSGGGCVLWVCARRSGPGCRALGCQQGASRCGWRATGWGVSRAGCSATGPSHPLRLASAGTPGGSAGSACVEAGSSAPPGASQSAVGSGLASPWVQASESKHWLASFWKLRYTWSPLQAWLPLRESQCPNVRDLQLRRPDPASCPPRVPFPNPASCLSILTTPTRPILKSPGSQPMLCQPTAADPLLHRKHSTAQPTPTQPTPVASQTPESYPASQPVLLVG